MKRCLSLLVCGTVLLVVVPQFATAQTARPERPYRGLFGGGVGEAEQLLALNVSVGGGYDDDVVGGSLGVPVDPGNPLRSEGGGYGYFGGNLSYSVSKTRVQFGASAATSSSYSPDFATPFVGAHSGSVGVSVRLASRTQVRLDQSVAYQPFHIMNTFPQLFERELGRAQPASQERGTIFEDSLTSDTTASLSQRLSLRSSLNFTYSYRLNDFAEGNRRFVTQSAGGHFSHELRRDLRLRLGYAYIEADYPTPGQTSPVRDHSLDVGVDYSRALSVSRRTTFSFGTGSAAITNRERTHYRITGNAILNHEIGRTWSASAAYDRNVEFLESLSEPFFGDSISIRIGGMANRRLQLYAGAGASIGHVGFSGEGTNFNTYAGTAGFHFGLTRYVGVGGNYSYYRYSFERAALLPPGLSRELDRQSVRAFITLWAPLMYRPRNPNVTR